MSEIKEIMAADGTGYVQVWCDNPSVGVWLDTSIGPVALDERGLDQLIAELRTQRAAAFTQMSADELAAEEAQRLRAELASAKEELGAWKALAVTRTHGDIDDCWAAKKAAKKFLRGTGVDPATGDRL